MTANQPKREKSLILIRHSEAETPRPGFDDFSRSITAKGTSRNRLTFKWLERHHFAPSIVLVSPALRTRETWAVLQKCHESFGIWESLPDAKFDDQLYLADVPALAGVVTKAVQGYQGDAEPVIWVIGHNNGLQDYVALMAQTQAFSLSTSAAVALRFTDIDDLSTPDSLELIGRFDPHERELSDAY